MGVELQTADEGITAFVEGRADAMMTFVFDMALVEADRALGAERGTRIDTRMKMLEIPEASEAVGSMKAAFPNASVVITNPLEGRPDFERLRNTRLPGVHEEIRTMSYDVVLAASSETDDDLVYKTVKALAANKDAFLITGEPQYVSFSKATMATNYVGVEYHPGAIRYYKEAGLWPGN
ncbi:MAG: TAXI family TRAP transporter solute-binding subunit [Paracoccaceae bacterium]|nr:TAXI family TRAP transporter solute-binding subunit [Paracoccaceae bacterium]